jgi:nucleotide-binding universal stress UspA family protein
MRAVLILTDFSEAAFRAAEYACWLAGVLQIQRVVLYHAYEVVIMSTETPMPPVKTNEELFFESMQALSAMRDRLKLNLPNTVAIDMLAENSFLPETINQRCQEHNVDLIVMGKSDKTRVDRLIAGNVTVRMLERSRYPLLMVPEDTVIGKEITTIVFATDLKDVASIPATLLYSFLDAFKAKLDVVNAGPAVEGEYVSESRKKAVEHLHDMLDKYSPSFYFVDGDNVAGSLLTFAGQHHASLLMTMPKTHNFFSSIFHKSVSKRLAYNSPIPLLCLPEAGM